ncbi:MAG: hypothetical protein HY326_04820 [Chloroflexi bacterium]|nr:hypothetical protein [Chloroflexota bacterium]
MGKPKPPTDTRAIRRGMDRAIAFWVVFFLVVVGSVLIALIWGVQTALQGMACLAGGAALLGLIWGILTLMERLVKSDDE